jgi:hypothetical protein
VRLVQAGEREAADIHKDLVAAVQQLIASVESSLATDMLSVT